MALSRATVYHPISFDLRNLAKTFRSRASAEDETIEYERAFGAYLGAAHCVAFPLARSAIYHALASKNFPRGSEIIMPPITIKPIMDAVVLLGLRPVFVDIEARTLCFDPEQLEAAITENTRGAILTYLFGIVPDVPSLVNICRRHELFVIEDFSHALNASFEGRKLGTFGDLGVYSSSATKTLDAYGGALAITEDPALAADLRAMQATLGPSNPSEVRAKVIRDLVWNIASHKLVWTLATFPLVRLLRRFNPELEAAITGARLGLVAATEPGPEYFERISNLQAEAGLSMLPTVEDADARRIANTERLRRELREDQCPAAIPGAHNVYWQCVIYPNDADTVQAKLASKGIDSATSNLSLISALGIYPEFERPCPVAERIKFASLFVPAYPKLSDADVERVATALREIMA